MIKANRLGLTKSSFKFRKSLTGCNNYDYVYINKSYKFEGFDDEKKDCICLSYKTYGYTSSYRSYITISIKSFINNVDTNLEQALLIVTHNESIKKYRSLGYLAHLNSDSLKVGCQNIKKDDAIQLANDILSYYGPTK